MAQQISSKRMRSGMGNILTFLLMILYIAGTSDMNRLHSLFHEQNVAVTHNEAQENDPCHRLIYHHAVEEGCDHQSHLTSAEKCQMCDLACHGDQTIVSDHHFTADQFMPEHFDSYKGGPGSYRIHISSSRAPPALT